MASSTALKEVEKREYIKKQIQKNFESPVTIGTFCGRQVNEVKIYPIDSYSTKFMSPKDQVTLAVDKVDIPEIRLTLSPVDIHPRYYANPDTQFYDYESRLSLNDGDDDAFRILAKSFENGQMWKFYMNKNKEYMIAYVKNVADGLLFIFDLYQEPDSPIPSISAIFAMIEPDIQTNNTKMIWEYLVTIHVLSNTKPKDSTIKSNFLVLKDFMRSAIASLGIFPSKL